MEFNDEVMHKVWEAEMNIMDVIHEVCEKNDLHYSLIFGTLLGAIRHGGFIPWDDDIDIMMPREDYDKLLSIWEQDAPAGYVIQTYKTDKELVNNFSKVRKDHTTFLQFDVERTRKYHKGIFVDIFPADRRADGKFFAKIQKAAAMVNLLYSRGYTSGRGGIGELGEKCLLSMPKKFYPAMRNLSEIILTAWNGRSENTYCCANTVKGFTFHYPEDMFENMQLVKFQNRSYFIPSSANSVLEIIYGDYMQLPPEEDRFWHHHPILIDFERNYEEIPIPERGMSMKNV